ncbi:neutral/alkaline non-lysosomal ceramidase N-terminal domain-containing protein [Gracilibacillus timonensis]|uniref:neutral/alkaline non-lysosomal ceramidase N-terminal domain-containing protein n=1 Tax=Gracilibacillus timonensis TaxID=1816696 RepID=UPI0008252278|nr:neutral/alkaline non-lysosomal ceramidase N-terminal domain-containing protein [Gracilibacillus timonensis]
MQLGVSKIDITPNTPIELAGFAHREGKADSVATRLWLKVFYFQASSSQFVYMIADLIWWDDQWVEAMKSEIEKKYQIDRKYICLQGTHNHSGPQTSEKFSRALGRSDAAYLASIQAGVWAGLDIAMNNQEEVVLSKQTMNYHMGVNRRKIMEDDVVMAPNKEGSTDNLVTALTFQTKQEEVKAIWIHYTCHPTITDANEISSEFCGILCEEIEKKRPKAIVAYLQGFCGDIRPNLVTGESFTRGSLADMYHLGIAFSKAVMDMLHKPPIVINLDREIKVKETRLLLPFNQWADPKPPADLADEWNRLSKNYAHPPFTLQYIQLSEELKLFACNGELVHQYGLYLKTLDENVLPLGYANGMVGYVPTANQMEEGGYESYDSIFYFGLPLPYDPSLETQIKSKMRTLMNDERMNNI